MAVMWIRRSQALNSTGGTAPAAQIPHDGRTMNGPVQVIVVDEHACALIGPAFSEIERLALGVPRPRLVRVVAHAMVSHPLDVEKDREIPVPAQLGAMQEDAIEEEDRAGGGLLFGRIDERHPRRHRRSLDGIVRSRRDSADRAGRLPASRSRRSHDRSPRESPAPDGSAPISDDGTRPRRPGSTGRAGRGQDKAASSSANIVFPAPSTPSIPTRTILADGSSSTARATRSRTARRARGHRRD